MPISGPKRDSPFALADLLDAGLDADPSGPAVITGGQSLSWAQLDEHSTRLARGYVAMGLQPGERVASVMPNRPALIVHYLACLKAGLVATPLNYRYKAPEIDHALEVSEASLLVYHAERDADIAASQLVPGLSAGTLRFGADELPVDEDPGASRLEDLIQASPDSVSLPRIHPDAPFFVFFTSGSTGPAKGVTHTVETAGWMVELLRSGLELTAGDVILTTTSHSHIGATLFTLAAFGAGAPLVMAKTPASAEVLPLLRQYRPTVTKVLPSNFYSLINDDACERVDFASLRYVASGGDKAPGILERQFEELFGGQMSEIYGLTEAGVITITPPGGPNKQGSAGRPGPGVTLSVRDETGAELEPGQVGRLWIRYPGVTVGYWNHPEATAEVFEDGWFDTGDLVRVDEDGYLWFSGRRKQIIVHDGSNIAPQEVEAALLEHPAVSRAGVVGVHDTKHGEDVWAYVSMRPQAEPATPGELIAFAAERVGYKAPEVVVALDELPVNSTGKTDRTALKRMAAEMHDAHIVC
ncbi:MAG: class I adenylate-forming enzyme family protein [Rubrobacteraceae bacterium]